MKTFQRMAAPVAAVLLLASLLGGCDAGPASDSPAATDFNPYPTGVAEPFYFRSASQWRQYAGETSARISPAD
jgi:hypothetical protein